RVWWSELAARLWMRRRAGSASSRRVTERRRSGNSLHPIPREARGTENPTLRHRKSSSASAAFFRSLPGSLLLDHLLVGFRFAACEIGIAAVNGDNRVGSRLQR